MSLLIGNANGAEPFEDVGPTLHLRSYLVWSRAITPYLFKTALSLSSDSGGF